MTVQPIPVEVCDGARPVVVLGLVRCGSCGHRATVAGVAPRQTRERPWRVPAEILGRHLARKAA